jgi:hypothetical protein
MGGMDPLLTADDSLLGVWRLQLSLGIDWLGCVNRVAGGFRCAYRIRSFKANGEELRDEEEVFVQLSHEECFQKLRTFGAKLIEGGAIGSVTEIVKDGDSTEDFLRLVELVLSMPTVTISA